MIGWAKPVTLVNACVVTGGGIARSLRFDDRVTGIDEAPRAGDVVVDLEGAFVLPGLINAHDHLELKDSRMAVDIYHVINNNHMASGLIAHVPAHRLLVEADLTTPNWDYQWWGGSLLDNIEYRKIAVDRVSPVHGVVAPLSDLVAQIERQVQGARDLCAKASAAQLYRPGCPVQYTRETQ